MGLLPVKPAEMLLSSTGLDRVRSLLFYKQVDLTFYL
jgi:hypothetical protein